MPENGNYITRGEFNIVYETLKDVQKDVKALLAKQAGDDAVTEREQRHEDRRAIWKPTLIAVTVSTLSAVFLHFF